MPEAHKIPHAVVAGLGASGRAAAACLLRRGWTVLAADSREAPAGLDAFLGEHPDLQVHLGGFDAGLVDGADLLVMSPGLSPIAGAAAPMAARARSAGIDIAGEIELFARELDRLARETGYAPKVIGITGTNGKTTTTVLTTVMCRAAGLAAVAAGNIGPNAVTELLKAEDAGALPDVWVLELSSFQLETTSSLRLTAGTILNITEDHIDWHGSMEAYGAAKARILTPGAVHLVNRGDEAALRAAGPRRCASFGADAPEASGDAGLEHRGGRTALVRRCEDGSLETLAFEDELRIAGRHNTMNALAAWTLARAAGASTEACRRALLEYRGEPHRVERIFSADGVDVVDDSKGTNVGAVVAAVEGFAAQGRRLMIILGGDGKGQDFSPLAGALAGRAGAAALIGQDAECIERAIESAGIPTARFETLDAAVEWLWERRRAGDVLLLSPACASWDMFRDYAHRSRVFAAAARRAAGLDEGDAG